MPLQEGNWVIAAYFIPSKWCRLYVFTLKDNVMFYNAKSAQRKLGKEKQ